MLLMKQISKDDFRRLMLTDQDVYMVDFYAKRVIDPWEYKIGDVLSILERETTFCFILSKEVTE